MKFKNLGNLKPGSRLLSKSSDRFKDLVPGFSFYYPENSNRVKDIYYFQNLMQINLNQNWNYGI